MTDIYSPPTAALSEMQSGDNSGSLERALNGQYEFDIGAIISEAWAKTKGCKWTFQVAVTLYIIAYILASVGSAFLFSGRMSGVQDVDPGNIAGALAAGVTSGLLQSLIPNILLAPAGVGLFMLGLLRAVGAPISALSIFGYYHKFVPLMIVSTLTLLLVMLGMVLLIIPGIYLAVSYYFAAPLVVDKNLGAWEAMEISRKATGKHWFGIFGFGIVIALINMATVFTLFIGLIWTIPMSVIAYGILYRNMFGCSETSINS